MNKRILGGLAAAVMLAGGLAFSSAGTASAQQPVSVNHPACAGVVDIAPGQPTPIAGIVFVKAGNSHTDVGFHEAGYVATSPNGSTVSHVDVCPASTRPSMIVFSVFVDGAFVCGDMTVVQTRTKTTTTFTPTISGFTEAVTVTQETQAREVTGAEKAACAITPPLVDNILPPAPAGQTPAPPAAAGQTPAPPAPAGQTPAQADVVAALPPTQVGASGAAPQVVVPAQGLPSTGIDGTGITALVALLMTSLGGAALFVSRRRNVMT